MVTITKSALETQKFGEQFARKIKGGGIVCLYGNLGAGKTTLVQGIARGLGLRKRPISPTFILARRYKIQDTKYKEALRYLWHIDLYRLDSLNQARAIGVEELIADPTNILLIEWPEKVESLLPRERWNIRLESLSANQRKILVEVGG